MSNEMLQKTIDLVSSLEVKTETQQIAKYELIEYTERLHKENQELKEQLEVGKEQYNDLVEEKENLQEQLDYLRGGEYLNQLRFERDMLQHVVDTNGVPSEVYDYLDCTHRNTELLEESQELKEQISYLRRDIDRRDAKITELEDERVPYTNEYVNKVKEVLNKAKSKLEEGIRFCENDSQGAFDKCNIAIKREQAVLNLLKEVE